MNGWTLKARPTSKTRKENAFDVYPLDYIVKPITAKRLEETVARAERGRAEKLGSGNADRSKRDERLLFLSKPHTVHVRVLVP
jgi:DNA-binding LytR/AlgR family response regulator